MQIIVLKIRGIIVRVWKSSGFVALAIGVNIALFKKGLEMIFSDNLELLVLNSARLFYIESFWKTLNFFNITNSIFSKTDFLI